jgi:ligand-binding sensor domain-containing protein
LPDSKGFLWLSSNKGVLRFDPKTETCRQYGLTDGLKTNEFNRSDNGAMTNKIT